MKNNHSVSRFSLAYLAGFSIILALPLLTVPPWFFPPDFGKTIIFRSILALLLLLFTWHFFYHKNSLNLPGLKNNKIIWALCALFLTFLAATIFSVDPYFSFWGWPIRGGGFVNFAGYIIFAVFSFMVVKKEDWPKLLDFSIIIGILVSFVAVIQYYGLLSNIFLPIASRPPSTMGNPILLAIYLLLLFFITLSLALKEPGRFKKTLYFLALVLFTYTIAITGTRAAWLGLLAGGIYFLLCYPKKIVTIKIAGVMLIIMLIGAVGYINLANPSLAPRLLVGNLLEDSRFSALRIGVEMVKEKPLLGWGMENFSVGFDKHYDAKAHDLAGIISWWDRAHNIILQTLSDAGILGLLAYLALFVAVFWKLHQLKHNETARAADQSILVPHAIQATLIGHFIANLFSFDAFGSYLIFFLLVGYSLHLTKGNTNSLPAGRQVLITSESTNISTRPGLVGKAIFFLLCCLVILFLWQYNLKPLYINAQINKAQALVNQKNCGEGLGIMEKAILQNSFLNSYARLQYVDMAKTCEEFYPQNKIGYLERGLELIDQAILVQPLYTRYWIFMGSATGSMAEIQPDAPTKTILIDHAYGYLRRALELAPQHQEIITLQARTAITAQDFATAAQYAQDCIAVNKDFGECYFYLALSKIYEKNITEAQKNLELAKNGFSLNSKTSLEQLANAYGYIADYPNLALTYEKLIDINPDSPQYHSSLAFFYSKLGRYKEAREQALKVLELSPESKPNVEAFLKTLPQ